MNVKLNIFRFHNRRYFISHTKSYNVFKFSTAVCSDASLGCLWSHRQFRGNCSCYGQTDDSDCKFFRGKWSRANHFRLLSFAKWSSALEICTSKKLTFSTSSSLRRFGEEPILLVVVLLQFDAVAVSPSADQVCGSLLLNCNCFGIKCAVLPGSCDLSLS